MSISQHPVAHRLAAHVSTRTKLLALVMGLPLIDGIFPALILAGALDTISEAIQIGVLIFGGSAMVTVILTEFHESRQANLHRLAIIAPLIVSGAVVEAAFAPFFESMLNTDVFIWFAAAVLFTLSAKMTSATLGEYLPRPAIILCIGMGISFTGIPSQVTLITDSVLMLNAAVAAVTGLAFASILIVFRPHIVPYIHIDRFRFGGAMALGLIGFSVLGLVPTNVATGALALAFILAINEAPSSIDESESDRIEGAG